MTDLKHKVEEALHNNRPFVVYKKPKSKKAIGQFQLNAEAYVLDVKNNNGFAFAPFNHLDVGYIIPNNDSEKIEYILEKCELASSSIDRFSDQKDEHIALVEKAINSINNSGLEKIVVSRKEQVTLEQIDIEALFLRLAQHYQNAFVYLWYHSETGIWMGASPEQLLKVSNSNFHVVALASTQEFKGSLDVNWGKKELNEHKIVVDYISEALNDFSINTSETYTAKAGNLLHLKADINGELNSKNDIQDLISKIHPTPATCGMPKELSKQFILENEHYKREFYTGYLGELNAENADLFVNLRCMKINLQSSSVEVFVGGGITKNSDSEKEWEETVSKSKVMKTVL